MKKNNLNASLAPHSLPQKKQLVALRTSATMDANKSQSPDRHLKNKKPKK